ncbi:MAG: Holliday junction branch migration protein RuvA [Pseudomonadota bacterium]
MIALLSGVLVDKSLESAVVDAGGVGYELFMPLPDLAALGAVGNKITVHVHTHVREDALKLFGFRDRHHKQVFERLINVTGVGPKLALALLSGIDLDELGRAVATKDATRLSKIPGIGKKTAERLCLELQDKLEIPAGPATSVAEAIDLHLVAALESLGYKRLHAEDVARNLDAQVKAGTPLEDLVREALKRLQGMK